MILKLLARFRVVLMSLRAAQANGTISRTHHGLTNYMQVSWAIGYLSIATDCVKLLQSLLVAATRNPPTPISTSAMNLTNLPNRRGSLQTEAPPRPDGASDAPDVKDEREEERKQYRGILGLLNLLHLVPLILGIVAGQSYAKAETDASQAQLVERIRSVLLADRQNPAANE